MHDHFRIGALNKETDAYCTPFVAVKGVEYICPECREPVQLKKGEIRIHHFSHMKGSTCQLYTSPSESQLHKEAKRLIQYYVENQTVQFLKKCTTCTDSTPIYTTANSPHTAVLEYKLDAANHRADVGLLVNGNLTFVAEVLNTHTTEECVRSGPWAEVRATEVLNIANSSPTELRLSCVRRIKYDCGDCTAKKAAAKTKQQQEEQQIINERIQKEACNREKQLKLTAEYVKQLAKAKEEQAQRDREHKLLVAAYEVCQKQFPVEDFLASLDQKDKIIHDLAAKMLKTRYDPKRSNAYTKALEKKLNA